MVLEAPCMSYRAEPSGVRSELGLAVGEHGDDARGQRGSVWR
jgi:hypothetical protein